MSDYVPQVPYLTLREATLRSREANSGLCEPLEDPEDRVGVGLRGRCGDDNIIDVQEDGSFLDQIP